jgi:hypothetical protein
MQVPTSLGRCSEGGDPVVPACSTPVPFIFPIPCPVGVSLWPCRQALGPCRFPVGLCFLFVFCCDPARRGEGASPSPRLCRCASRCVAASSGASYSNFATSSWSELIGTWQTDSVALELPVQEPFGARRNPLRRSTPRARGCKPAPGCVLGRARSAATDPPCVLPRLGFRSPEPVVLACAGFAVRFEDLVSDCLHDGRWSRGVVLSLSW